MRIFFGLALTLLLAVAAFAQSADSMPMAVSKADMKFDNVANVPACAKAAPLHGDPSKGAFVLMIRMSAGCGIPRHWHTPAEQLSFLSGTATITMPDEKAQTLAAGSFIHLPPKNQHSFVCKTACQFFLAGDGPFDIHYVDDAGQEISADQALQPMMKRKGKAKKQ